MGDIKDKVKIKVDFISSSAKKKIEQKCSENSSHISPKILDILSWNFVH